MSAQFVNGASFHGLPVSGAVTSLRPLSALEATRLLPGAFIQAPFAHAMNDRLLALPEGLAFLGPGSGMVRADDALSVATPSGTGLVYLLFTKIEDLPSVNRIVGMSVVYVATSLGVAAVKMIRSAVAPELASPGVGVILQVIPLEHVEAYRKMLRDERRREER